MSILSKNTTIAGKKPLLPSNQYTDFKPNTDELGVSYKIIDKKTIDLNDSDYFEEGNYSFSGDRTSTANVPTIIGNNEFHLTVTKSNLRSQSIPDGSMGFSVYVFQTIQYQLQIYTRHLQLMINNKLELINSYALTSWAKIWTEDTDGSNSGLDADLLDGVQGDVYLKNNQSKSDFNDCDKPGIYALYRNGGVSNAPSNNSYWGCIACSTDPMRSNNYMAQIAFTDNNAAGPVYIRYRTVNWQPWHVLWNGTNTGDYLLTSNLLTELKKVDGTGSGLDADLLDGKHANEFLVGDSDTYYINSQSDFDSMITTIGETTYLDSQGLSNVVFNCNVDARKYDNMISVSGIKHIEGNGHIISGIRSGLTGINIPDYFVKTAVSNLIIDPLASASFQGIQYMKSVDNCQILIGDTSDLTASDSITGFKYCSNLSNCYIKIDSSSSYSSLPIINGFYMCDNLINCLVAYKSNSVNGDNLKSIAFNVCYNLYNCNVDFIGDSPSFSFSNTDLEGAGLYSFCHNLNNCTVSAKHILKSICFYGCYGLYCCKLDGDGQYINAGFSNCFELYNCDACSSASDGYEECNIGLNNVYNGAYTTVINSGTTLSKIVEFMNTSPTEMTEATEANIDSWIS